MAYAGSDSDRNKLAIVELADIPNKEISTPNVAAIRNDILNVFDTLFSLPAP